MSQHRMKLEWIRGNVDFSYQSYSRNHTWTFPSGTVVNASAAPKYLGDSSRVDPEEALVAAISSCHMLTFLAIASRKRIVVDRYTDDAVGTMSENDAGRLAVTEVVLRPAITFADNTRVTEEDIQRMHELAHHECFIANSVTTNIIVSAPD